jgi:PST family polysaccharide transporter
MFKFLEGRPLVRGVLANTSWLFGYRAVRIAVSLSVGVLVARYLGPERYGALNYAIAFTSIFATLATLGLDNIVPRDLVLHKERRAEILGTALWLRLFAGLAGLVICSVLIFLLKPDDSLARFLVVLLAAATMFQAADTVDMWFQAEVRASETVPYKLAVLALASSARVWLVLNHAPLWAFGAIIFFETASGALALAVAWQRRAAVNFIWRWSTAEANRLLKESWPLAVSALAIYVQARVDQVMLGQLIGERPLGLFSVAVQMTDAFNFIPVVLISAAFPAITRSLKESRDLYMRRMLDVYRLMAILTLVIGIPIALLSGPIVDLLFGQDYIDAQPLLATFIWTRVLTNYGVARSLFIAHDGLFSFALVTAVLGAVCNTALNFWWIPLWGPYGAIAAFALSFGLTTFMADWFYKPARENFYLMLQSMVTFHRIFREELR